MIVLYPDGELKLGSASLGGPVPKGPRLTGRVEDGVGRQADRVAQNLWRTVDRRQTSVSPPETLTVATLSSPGLRFRSERIQGEQVALSS